MKYVVKKTAMYGSSTYGPYSNYQEALIALKELENNTFSECFFSMENLRSEERKSQNEQSTEHPWRVKGFNTSNCAKI